MWGKGQVNYLKYCKFQCYILLRSLNPWIYCILYYRNYIAVYHYVTMRRYEPVDIP